MDRKHSKRSRHDSRSDGEFHVRKHHKQRTEHDDRSHDHSHRRDVTDKRSRKHRKVQSTEHRGDRFEEISSDMRIKHETHADDYEKQQRNRSHRDDKRRERRREKKRKSDDVLHTKSKHKKDVFVEHDPNIPVKHEKDAEKFEKSQKERSRHDAKCHERRRDKQQTNGDMGLNSKPEPIITTATNADIGVKPEPPKETPTVGESEKLPELTNTFRGVVTKYNEPPEAATPTKRWRLYIFKGDSSLGVLKLHRQSAYRLGRDRQIADIPVDHTSCSSQHAILQYRSVTFIKDDGTTGSKVRPFIMDLESSNGTYLNYDRIEPRKYYELQEKDLLKFGLSTREYVLLHENMDLSEITGGESSDDNINM